MTPVRGFSDNEFAGRVSRAQRLMHRQQIDALLLTTEPDVRYFSGFLTQFWQSPTRPWFLIVPRQGKPVAVIPEIGANHMAAGWLDAIRTWPAPVPDDDGLSLLTATLHEVAGVAGRVGLPMGPESHLRMPLADFERLRATCHATEFVDATPIIRALRLVKSPAEIAKISHICQIASNAFEALPTLLLTGDLTEREVFRRFKIELLQRGADDVPYLVGGAGPDGYDNIIAPPSGRRLQPNDLLMFDTGALFDGYFCDLDRNFAIGYAADGVRHAYQTLYRATEVGLQAARPGITCADLFVRMWQVLAADNAGGYSVGRLGHGLGMQLTEWPSLTPTDQTVLQAGMVLTLEPGLQLGPGRMMVHEEDIVIRDGGPELLTHRAPPELPVI